MLAIYFIIADPLVCLEQMVRMTLFKGGNYGKFKFSKKLILIRGLSEKFVDTSD